MIRLGRKEVNFSHLRWTFRHSKHTLQDRQFLTKFPDVFVAMDRLAMLWRLVEQSVQLSNAEVRMTRSHCSHAIRMH
jgi:hypothetical protein